MVSAPSSIVASILYGIAVAIGFILLIIPGVYLLVRWLFVPQAIIIERVDIFQAFARSSDLVRGSWWRVFIYGLVLYILVFAVVGALERITGVGGVVALLVQVIIQPFAVGVLTLLYYDLRARKGEEVLAAATAPF